MTTAGQLRAEHVGATITLEDPHTHRPVFGVLRYLVATRIHGTGWVTLWIGLRAPVSVPFTHEVSTSMDPLVADLPDDLMAPVGEVW